MKRLTILPLAAAAMLAFSCKETPVTPSETISEEITPHILGHRGGRLEQEENTLEAFKATYEAGCHGFETDIHFTSDHELVIMHDGDIERMTGIKGKVEELSSEYLRSIQTKGGHSIPFLGDLLDYFKTCEGLYVEWELKTNEKDYSDELIKEYCDKLVPAIFGAKKAEDLYIISSFDLRPLLYIKENYPEVPVMLISGDPVTNDFVDYCIGLGINRCACTLWKTSRSAVRYAHEKGMKVNLWPGSKVEDTVLAAMLEADHLCTDIPSEAMAYVKEHKLNIMY